MKKSESEYQVEDSWEDKELEMSDEEWYPVTLQFEIPGTGEFHRIDILDKDEEEAALSWMYEQCGEDFEDYEWR